MARKNVLIGGLVALMLLLGYAAVFPQAVSAATCNGNMQIAYVPPPPPANPGDTITVQLTLFTGTIDGGTLNQATWKKVRFDLACDVDGVSGIPCTPETPSTVVKYESNISSSNCFDAGGNPVTFTDNSAAGNFSPNEVIFTPNNPFVINANTPVGNGCVLEFDVQVASYSHDSTPDEIEQFGGFRTVAGVPDATCDNGLSTNGSQSGSILLAPPTPTPTSTNTETSTPTNTPIPPTSTPTNTPTNTPPSTNTPTNSPTRTQTNTPPPSICQPGLGGLIPGYCHSSETADCAAEFCSFGAPPPGVNVLHPPNTLTCKEGDPACDFGPAGDGTCTFKISLCFNVSDTRIPCVLPDQIGRFHLTDPAESHPHPGADTANRDALEAALLGLPGATLTNTPERGIAFVPQLTNTDICTAPVLINLPLRHTSLGPRISHSAIRYRVFKNASDHRALDRDILRLYCTP